MSKPAVTAFVLGCVLGFGVAFLALRTDRTGDPPAAAAPAPSAPRIALSDDQVGARVKEILSGKDPVRRITELSALLPSLGPSAVPALLEEFEAAPLDGGDPELVLLGMWWARFDPKAALTWTTTDWRARYGAVIAGVFRGWAQHDPKAALGMARGLAFDVQRELATDAAIAGWDESGQPGLIEALGQLNDVQLQGLSETFARRRVVTLGAAGAFRWVDSLQNPRFQQVMGERIAGAAAAAKDGGALAAAWAEPRVRSDDRLSNYPRRIATRWVVHDPEPAMAWLATLPAGADRKDGVTEAFRAWMLHDRAAASAWIEKTELLPWNEPAMAVYTRAIASERPKEAMEMAQRIREEGLRNSTMIVVGQTWAESDRPAAEAWLAQADVPERVRRTAVMVGSNPAHAERRRAREEAAAEAMAAPPPN